MEPAARTLNPLRAVVALLLAGLLLLAARPAALAAALPLQSGLLALLMPEFAAPQLKLESFAGAWRVAARLVTDEHVVLHGRAWEPGLGFEAHTPARQPLRAALLFALGAAWLLARGGGSWRRAALLLPLGLVVLPLLHVPVVLAGQVWALVVAAPEPSLRWALVLASNALLHGADLALAAALLYLAGAARSARPAMVLSDHVRAWSRRTMPGP